MLGAARAEIRESWRRACADHAGHPRADELFDPERLPAFHDPFAGGGAIPLEAQRLGLEAHASDLNPVAVLITKAMIEVPPRFAGRPPVNPGIRANRPLAAREWHGAAGLAEDVRYYGKWMRDEAERRIGHLYPKVQVTPEMVRQRPDLKRYQGRELTVIAWLWARTVRSPNPAFADVEVPLASTFMLSTKPGKEAYVEPVIEGRGYRFEVRVGAPPDRASTQRGTKSGGSGSPFLCLMSGSPMPFDYVRTEGNAGRMGSRLMAVVAEGERSRIYLSPTADSRPVLTETGWRPDLRLEGKCRVNVSNYGFDVYGDLFTPRQLVALTTFSDLVGKAMERVRRDAAAAALPDDAIPLRDGGTGATAYAQAVGLYLTFVLDRCADYYTALGRWQSRNQQLSNLFGRQAIPMVWDHPEANPFSGKGGSFDNLSEWTIQSLPNLGQWDGGESVQADASGAQTLSSAKIVSTDPPYYDNIGYADLSDFFYVWLRRSLKPVFPELFATVAVPKAEELVATPYRHGSKERAEAFFLNGMSKAVRRLAEQAHPGFPTTIYYAFKQSETRGDTGTASTGWETFLDAAIRSGFAITGTWPMRTELSHRMIGMGSNALASSIILACRRCPADAPLASRREFLAALRAELPPALRLLQSGNIAPVDLAQAAIGPGMAVYTRYAKVLRASGEPLSVREALALINEVLDEVLAEQEGELDPPTRWALAWFEQHGFGDAPYGEAETLSKAKNTTVAGLVQTGLAAAAGGRVRLLRPEELPADWDPQAAAPLTAWAAVHHLVRRHAGGQDQNAAAALLRRLGGTADAARELAYRLYTTCERAKRPADAFPYNALVQSWGDLKAKALDPGVGRVAGRLIP